MAIRPVDYQILMPKTNELARIQNEEQYKLTGHLQQKAESSNKKADQETESVHSQKEAQKTVINSEQKGRDGKREKPGKNKKKDNENQADQNSLKSKFHKEHTIDIRL